MRKDRLTRILLAAIAVLLAANLVASLTFAPVHGGGSTGASMAQDLHFKSKNSGVAVACSEDGRIVYAADDEDVYRSQNFGAAGSWEHVLK